MLFVLTGSSGAGKQAVLARRAPLVEDLALHDFDAAALRRMVAAVDDET
jgi:hypothetical protein